MKNITAASFLAISSVMFGAKAFPQPAGTVVDYNFKNDRFGTNDRLKLGLVSPHIRSPRRGIYERDPGHWSLYMRDADAGITHERNAYPDAYPGKPSTIGGGNQVQNTYDLKNDKIGNNNNLYMQASTGVKGGNTAAAVSTSGGKNGKDKRGLYESSGLKDRKLNDVLYERDAYADIEAHYNKREALPHVVSTGCNTFLNNPTLKEYKSGNGQTVSMQSSSRQFGGNTIRGRGDSNYAKRWLQARDLEIAARSAELESLIFEREALGNGGAAKGGDNKPQAGNIVSNKPSSKGQGPVNQSAQMSQSGGNNFGGKGGANTGNGGQASFHLYAREAYPEAEAEAEADAYPYAEAEADLLNFGDGLYARDVYPEAYAEAEAEAEAEADAEAEAEAEAEADAEPGMPNISIPKGDRITKDTLRCNNQNDCSGSVQVQG